MEYKRNLRLGVEGYTDDELSLDVYGNVNVSGNISIAGTVTYDDVTNVDAIGLVTARSGIDIGYPGTATTLTADGNAVFSGIVTAAQFFGDGSGLDGVTGVSIIAQEVTGDPVYPTFASNVGVTTLGIAQTGFVYVPSTGSVGIGSTQPIATLDVNGTANISDNITLGSNKTVSSTGGLTISNSAGLLSITSGGLAGNINISGLSVFIGNGSGTLQAGTFSGKRATTYNSNGSDLTVQGGDAIAPSGNANIVDGGDLYIKSGQGGGLSGNAGNVYIDGGGTNGGTGTVGNVLIGTVQTSNVGIGSTQPIATLDVNGDVNVSGFSTFIGIGTFQSDLYVGGNVNVSGVLTAERLYSSVYGEFTGGGISGTNIVGTSLSISGISTLGTLQISSGIVTATSGIITYYGDGSGLTNISSSSNSGYANTAGISTYATSSGIATVAQGLTGTPNINVGIVTATSYNGSGINLTGVVTSITAGSGISVDQSTGDVTITASVSTGITAPTSPSSGNLWYNSNLARTFIYYDDGDSSQWVDASPFNYGESNIGMSKNVVSYVATEAQTTFSATYSVGFVDVFLNGVKLSEDQYTASNGTSIVLNDGVSLNDIVEIVGFVGGIIGVGIATAGGTVGTGVTLFDFRGPGISTVTVSSGIGTINITGGTVTSSLTIGTRTTAQTINLVGVGATILLRSGIGTLNF